MAPEILAMLAAIAAILVPVVAFVRWLLAKSANIVEVEVDTRTFLEKSGLGERLKAEGYRCAWIPAYKVHERRTVDGWELVVERAQGGKRVCYRHVDSPAVGGYVILHKKKE